MIKKIGIILIILVYLGVYISLFLKLFYSTDNSIEVFYTKDEIMFGSSTLIDSFIVMTIILLIYCNYFINLLLKKKSKVQQAKRIKESDTNGS